MSRNRPTLSAKTHRYQQSQLEQFVIRCKHCDSIIEDGDDCTLCTDNWGTLPISIQYAESQAWEAEQINGETDEYWRATQ